MNKTPYPKHIEDRIPEEWGKYLGIPEEWYLLVTALDGEIAEFAPNYVVHQVKAKFSGLRYYIDASTVPDEHRQAVESLIRLAEHVSYLIPPKRVVLDFTD